MTNDERDPTPEMDDTPADLSPDELRYAPPVDEAPEDESPADETEFASEDNPDSPVAEELDIAAALAAVSSLSDMLAEQEAAEQARIAQEEAEAQAQAERQARLEHPERFFPVPPMTTLKRGQSASVIPAIVLIVVGAGLTFALTAGNITLTPDLIAAVIGGGLGITLIARWLASGRWARGSLFFGLAFLLVGGIIFYLAQPASLGIERGWPLVLAGLGLPFVLTAFLAYPSDRRLLFPGIALIAAGVIALTVTTGMLGDSLLTAASTFWPVALIALAIIWLLPIIFRQRH